MKNIQKIAAEILSQQMSEKDKKVIWNFVDGNKSLYKKIEEIYERLKNQQIEDIYFSYARAYVNDDSDEMSKYKNLIRKDKVVKHKKDFN
jgi:hypothetical protein